MSDSFDAPEFRRFCHACYHFRRGHPSLTISALRTILTVARADDPMTYQDLADRVGQAYVPMAHQIAALSDGREKRAGLGLLERRTGHHARARLVACSTTGATFVQRFFGEPHDPNPTKATASDIIARTLTALDAVLARSPKLSLGTLCVYLYVATHQNNFAYDGQPVNVIAKDLGVSNLPKHLRTLENGTDKHDVSRLIGFYVNDYDQRIKLPFLTKAGVELQYELIRTLTRRTVTPPRRPREQSLDALESPADVGQLTDADFEEIIWG